MHPQFARNGGDLDPSHYGPRDLKRRACEIRFMEWLISLGAENIVEGFLRQFDGAYLLHPLFALLLIVQVLQFPLMMAYGAHDMSTPRRIPERATHRHRALPSRPRDTPTASRVRSLSSRPRLGWALRRAAVG